MRQLKLTRPSEKSTRVDEPILQHVFTTELALRQVCVSIYVTVHTFHQHVINTLD